MGAPERGCQTPARHRHHVGLDTAGLQGRRTTGRGIRRIRPLRLGGVRPERHRPHQVRHAARTGRSGRGAPRERDSRLPRHGDESEDRRRLYREVHGLRGRSREPRASDRRTRKDGRVIPFRGAATNILPSNGTGTTSREPTRFTRPANGPSTSSRAKARSGAKASTARTGTTIS